MTAMPPISPSSALSIGTVSTAATVGKFSIPENNEELGEAITRLAGHINAAQYRFLKLLAALVEREAWLGHSGMKTPAHWLNYYCGIDLGAAREKVRVAKCLATLPLIDAAFSTGVISYSKVRAMTRSATPENEAHLLQVARHGTAQHVETLVRRFARASRLADPRQDKCQYDAREFSWYHDDDGMLVFKGRLPAVEGAAFLKAMEAMVQTLGQQDATRRERTSQDLANLELTGQHSANHEAAKKECTHQDFANLEATEQNLPGHESAIQEPGGPANQPGKLADVSAETSDENPAPTFTQKRADALVAMADLAMAQLVADGKPVCTADKYQVIIHINNESCHVDVSAETPQHRPQEVSAETSKHRPADVSAETSQHQSQDVSAETPQRRPQDVSAETPQHQSQHVSAETPQHQPEDVFAEMPPHRHCTLESNACDFPLSAATARRLACDAALVTVLEDTAGNVLNVGRKTRTIPPAIRRVLHLRDQGCRFPGCCETRFVDAHHIHHWCDGGETSLANLILLCRHHHTLLHRDGFEIVKCTAGYEFVRPDGRKLPRALATQFAEGDESPDGSLFLETEADALGLDIDARTAVMLWQGESMDYGFAVGTLMDIAAAHAQWQQQVA